MRLGICTVSPEPMLFAHIRSKPRGILSQRTRGGFAERPGIHTEKIDSTEYEEHFSHDTDIIYPKYMYWDTSAFYQFVLKFEYPF